MVVIKQSDIWKVLSTVPGPQKLINQYGLLSFSAKATEGVSRKFWTRAQVSSLMV